MKYAIALVNSRIKSLSEYVDQSNEETKRLERRTSDVRKHIDTLGAELHQLYNALQILNEHEDEATEKCPGTLTVVETDLVAVQGTYTYPYEEPVKNTTSLERCKLRFSTPLGKVPPLDKLINSEDQQAYKALFDFK